MRIQPTIRSRSQGTRHASGNGPVSVIASINSTRVATMDFASATQREGGGTGKRGDRERIPRQLRLQIKPQSSPKKRGRGDVANAGEATHPAAPEQDNEKRRRSQRGDVR